MIPPRKMRVVKTGIAIEFTKPRAGAMIRCRSGMASQDASVEGGEIDAGYRGELKVMLRNHNEIASMHIKKGMEVRADAEGGRRH
jgi:dUTPase